MMRTMRRAVLGLMLVMGMLAGGSGCSTNPATGQWQLNMVGENEAIALGQKAAPDFLKEYGGPIPSNEIQSYVSNLGQRLAKVSERPDLPWQFHAVDSSVVNAFALPGGQIFVTRGLMAKLKNEAELAGVLGHEIGHVTAEHVGQRMTQSAILNVGLQVTGALSGQPDAVWLKVLGVGSQLYQLKFSRGEESQADELGMRYMSRIGYNPVGQLQVMQVLQSLEGESGGTLEILSTHPSSQTRIDHVKSLIKSTYPNYDQPGKYQLDPQSYQQNVLEVLKTLPPPPEAPPPKQ